MLNDKDIVNLLLQPDNRLLPLPVVCPIRPKSDRLLKQMILYKMTVSYYIKSLYHIRFVAIYNDTRKYYHDHYDDTYTFKNILKLRNKYSIQNKKLITKDYEKTYNINKQQRRHKPRSKSK